MRGGNSIYKRLVSLGMCEVCYSCIEGESGCGDRRRIWIGVLEGVVYFVKDVWFYFEWDRELLKEIIFWGDVVGWIFKK